MNSWRALRVRPLCHAAFLACAGCGALIVHDDLSSSSRGDGGSSNQSARPVDATHSSESTEAAASGPPAISYEGACGAPWVVLARQIPNTESYEIYARRADGTSGHPLVLPHSNPYAPAVSPDGTSLVYTTFDRKHLYLHRFTDGLDLELDHVGARWVALPTLSPNGALAAFGDTYTVFLTPTDGGAGHMLVPESALPGNADHPVFTADSEHVVFGVPHSIESLGIDGTGLVPLLPDETSFGTPGYLAFSPDFANLAAVGLCPGDTGPALRVYSTASLPAMCATGRMIVSTEQKGPGACAWGPDGIIAFESFPDIMLVLAAGGTPWNLTRDLTAWGATAPDTIEVLGSLTPTFAPACTNL